MNIGEQKRLAVLSSPSEVRLLARFCTEAISDIFSEDDIAAIELAIVEAANNIVQHAYNFEEGHPLQLTITHRGDHLEMLFFDKGSSFDYTSLSAPDFNWDNVKDIPEGGWGIYLINSIMDNVEYDSQGNINILKMVKTIPSDKLLANSSVFDIEHLKYIRKSTQEVEKLRAALSESEEAVNEMAEELSSAYESLNLFYSLSRDVALISNLNVFLKNTLERIISVANADWGIVRLKDNNSLIFFTSTDNCPAETLQKEIKINETGKEIENIVAFSLKEYISDSYHKLPVMNICVPIVGLDEFLGTILLGKANESERFLSGDSKLARAMADQIAVSIENNRLYSRAMDAKLDKQEMEIATDLQQKLMVRKLPDVDGLQFFTRAEPAKRVGGDYLTLEKVNDSTVFMVVCDAMGKGMSASYFSLLSHMAIRSILLQQDAENISPGELLSLVNRVMFRDFDLFGMFMTSFVGKIDINKNLLSYASAGHCQPILFARDKGIELLDTFDFMLGVDEEIEYTDFHIDFLPDMKLLIYSDGLTDVVGRDGEIVGVDPLVDICGDVFSKYDIVNACEKVYDYAVKISGDQLQDDISMIGVARL